MSSTTRTTPPPTLTALSDVKGRIITSENPGYDQARAVFYGGIDKRPAAIVRVTDVADVRRVVETARREGLELAVRSGGHSVSGHRSRSTPTRERRGSSRARPRSN